MAKYSIENSTLTAIADAIREKMGTRILYTPAQMASVISAIQVAPDFSLEMDFGTYISSYDEPKVEIATALSKVYVAFIWCADLLLYAPVSTNAILSGQYLADDNGNALSCCTYIDETTGSMESDHIESPIAEDSSFIINSESAYLFADYTYHWVAWGMLNEW